MCCCCLPCDFVFAWLFASWERKNAALSNDLSLFLSLSLATTCWSLRRRVACRRRFDNRKSVSCYAVWVSVSFSTLNCATLCDRDGAKRNFPPLAGVASHLSRKQSRK